MEFSVFTELSLLLVLAAAMAALMRLLRQPLIIGHIITGLLAGPAVFNLIRSAETINLFSELGIALLLFIVGISLSPLVIKDVGKTSVLTGLGQIVFTSLIGWGLAKALGFNNLTALYLAVALTFSSTIIILKLLSDKLALEKLYGKIAVGFLIVQDVVAVISLILISALAQGSGLGSILAVTLFKGLALALPLIAVVRWLLPKLAGLFARQQELLFLLALGWGLGLASLFKYAGFSIEIGALVAGVALASQPYSVEIGARLKPLRDFFIVIFFILLGAQMVVGSLGSQLAAIIIFSLFILVGNPLIVLVLMKLLGYSQRTGFMAGLTVAQISEFSLVLVLLGQRLGHLEPEIISLVTAVGLLTIAGSTYLIMYAEKIYDKIAPGLRWLDMLSSQPAEREAADQSPDAILFGLNRIGYDFLQVFRQRQLKFMVVDFNPEVVQELKHQQIDVRYGDADDSEFLQTLPLAKAKIVVSTIPDFTANLLLADELRRLNKRAILMVLSHDIKEALKLYERGVSYVVLPHFLGGRFAAELVNLHGAATTGYNQERKWHLAELQARLKRGHEHPIHERYRV